MTRFLLAGLCVALASHGFPAHGAILQPVTVAVSPQSSEVFMGPAPDGSAPLLYTVTGAALTALPLAPNQAPKRFSLPDGLSAFDLADTDGDGIVEVIGYQGGAVIRVPLTGERTPPETLFTTPSLYAGYKGPPFPTVLVMVFEDAQAIAVPSESGFELRRLDGERAHRIEPEAGAQALSPFGAPFTTYPVEPPRIAPGANGLEMRIEQTLDYSWWLSRSGLEIIAQPETNARPATDLQARDAASRPAEAWPWIPLDTESSERRILFAFVSEPDEATLVRLQRPRENRTARHPSAIEITPPRRYPGSLILSESGWPDVDGDGIHDLLLWQSPQPGLSIDTFSRAAQDGTWPITMTVHTFDHGQGIFKGRPAASIRARLPIVWFLAQQDTTPLRGVVTEDFNGDGRSDLGMLTGPREYAIWLGGARISREPDYTAQLNEPAGRIAMVGRVGPSRAAVIALWSANQLHALYIPQASTE